MTLRGKRQGDHSLLSIEASSSQMATSDEKIKVCEACLKSLPTYGLIAAHQANVTRDSKAQHVAVRNLLVNHLCCACQRDNGVEKEETPTTLVFEEKETPKVVAEEKETPKVVAEETPADQEDPEAAAVRLLGDQKIAFGTKHFGERFIDVARGDMIFCHWLYGLGSRASPEQSPFVVFLKHYYKMMSPKTPYGPHEFDNVTTADLRAMKLRCKCSQTGSTFEDASSQKDFVDWVRGKRHDLIKELRMFLTYVERTAWQKDGSTRKPCTLD